MPPISPQSISPTNHKDVIMSGVSENGPNGFTPVNGPMSPTGTGARAVDPVLPPLVQQKDWQSTHGDPSSGHGPYHVAPTKRRFTDIEAGGEAVRGLGPTPSTSPGLSSAAPRSADVHVDPKFGQTQSLVSRGASWSGQDEDTRIAELLQQESGPRLDNGMSSSPNRGEHMDGGSPGMTDPQSAEPLITNAGLQVDMKKRKRAFTNRTKTGCTTCRKRKKKCDEAKPACNNCIRGGFTCLGYDTKRSVQDKQPPISRAVQLAPASERDRDREYWHSAGGARPAPRGLNYGSHPLPVGIHDSRQGHAADPRPVTQWSGSAYNASTPRSIGSENRSLPPIPASYRTPRDPPALQTISPMFAANLAINQIQGERVDYPNSIGTTNGFDHKIQSKEIFTYAQNEGPHAQKRLDCRKACGAFNRHAADGSSADELKRHLKAIIIPQSNNPLANSAKQPTPFPEHIVVEAPFYADYGYNLELGTNICISSGCTFKDPKPIRIGNWARIGPNVTISGECDSPGAVDTGRNAVWKQGVEIAIGEFVVIGAGCIIATNGHEITIGDGSKIGAGCVISTAGRPVTIGKDCVVGPGSVIQGDLADRSTVFASQPLAR